MARRRHGLGTDRRFLADLGQLLAAVVAMLAVLVLLTVVIVLMLAVS